jgi:hypothetical protein
MKTRLILLFLGFCMLANSQKLTLERANGLARLPKMKLAPLFGNRVAPIFFHQVLSVIVPMGIWCI